MIGTVLDLVGRTPLLRLQRLVTPDDATVWIKWERTNPGGSIKDRPAKFIIEEAERRGLLAPGGTIIESSSGNFGISLAMIGAAKGYRVIILVDPKTTAANLAVLRAYGAEIIVVTEPDDSGSYHKTRITRANQLAREIPGAFRPDQCFNLLNSVAHEQHTARELLAACGNHLNVVVAAVSTGGQLGGLARYLKAHAPHVHIVGVDARGSTIFGGSAHPYLTPGVGLSWTPDNLDLTLVDQAFQVADADAFMACRALARHEGILAGGSSGAVLMVALHYAQHLPSDARIACLFADGGERYLQTIYDDAWLQAHNCSTTTSIEAVRRQARQLSPIQSPPAISGTALPALAATLGVPETTRQFNAAIMGQRHPRVSTAMLSERVYPAHMPYSMLGVALSASEES